MSRADMLRMERLDTVLTWAIGVAFVVAWGTALVGWASIQAIG